MRFRNHGPTLVFEKFLFEIIGLVLIILFFFNLAEQKEDFQNKLLAQKLKVELLQQSVADAKLRYSDTLKSLEGISEEIHEKRLLSRPREPGVGAEKSSSPPQSLNFDLDQCDIVSLV